ncbi:MAG TPA: hypothetical protein PLV21_02115 [Cyclobacteriaceae bacterium]|nr:hypothetical protein [Cyclobacteriaceae bacterium]HRJ80653.1 hypothetical protein [Cyclobacteriaceae bacterium]
MALTAIRQRIQNLTFESQIILLICGLGSFRVSVAVSIDLLEGKRPAELLVDAGVLFILLVVLYITWRKPPEKIHIAIGFILTLLLALNFIQFGGVDGYSKFNYYAGLFILIMTYNQRARIITVSFHLLVLLIILVLEYTDHPMFDPLFIQQHPQSSDFWFTLLTLSFFTFYLKEVTVQKGESLTKLNDLLGERVRESRKLNRMLAEKNEALKKAQVNLENEVSRRSRTLQVKNQAIENFIQTNQQELIYPVQELVATIHTLDERLPYAKYLKSTGMELRAIAESINTKLDNNIPLDRKNTRYHESAT